MSAGCRLILVWAMADVENSGARLIMEASSKATRTGFLLMFVFFIFDFLFMFWPSLTAHFEKPFLAVHRCTARDSAGCYAERWLRRVESLKTFKRENAGCRTIPD